MNYKDLTQESWGRADSDMPQEYLNGILAQITPKRREPKTDADLDGSDRLHAIEGRLMGRKQPRFGQPDFNAPLIDWYREYQFRLKHPHWYEREYHYTDDGRLIHSA